MVELLIQQSEGIVMDTKQFTTFCDSVFSEMTMRQDVKSAMSGVLANMYSTEYRKYHGMCHIIHIFEFQQAHKISLTLAQKLAILYHDVVYLPGCKENEELSAKFMVAALKPFAPHEALDEASRIVIDTKQHFTVNPFYMSQQSKLVLDLDISSMSLDYDKFLWWNRLVEEEFKPFGFNDLSKRIAFFEMFLSKSSITQSTELSWMEESIRNNIARYISHLKNVV